MTGKCARCGTTGELLDAGGAWELSCACTRAKPKSIPAIVVSAPALLANEAPPIAPSYRLEKHFQAVVIARAKLYGWRVHFVFNSRKSPEGWPDLTLVRGKVTLFRELKRSRKEKPTPAQLDWLEALRDAGHDAKVWTPENREEIYETLR